jgi:hypothetical protein
MNIIQALCRLPYIYIYIYIYIYSTIQNLKGVLYTLMYATGRGPKKHFLYA